MRPSEWPLDCVLGWICVPHTNVSAERPQIQEATTDWFADNCRKISQTLCRQRLSVEGSHKGGYPLHKGTVRSHQNGRQETGWGYTSPMGQRKIHRLGFHSHPHVCGFLPPSVVIGTRRGCGTCCG